MAGRPWIGDRMIPRHNLPINFAFISLVCTGLALAGEYNIPREYLVEANRIPEFWVSTVEGVNRFLDRQVRQGTVRQFGTTAGGRSMRRSEEHTSELQS